MRLRLLRVYYALFIAAALLTFGAGDYRTSILVVTALFSYASIVERFLHLIEFVPVVLHAACVITAVIAVSLFNDLLTQACAVGYALIPFIADIAFDIVEERGG